MGVTCVEKREAALTAGAGCDITGQSVDDLGSERGHQELCDPGSLESAASGTARVLASVLGRTAQRVRESGAARVASARAG